MGIISNDDVFGTESVTKPHVGDDPGAFLKEPHDPIERTDGRLTLREFDEMDAEAAVEPVEFDLLATAEQLGITKEHIEGIKNQTPMSMLQRASQEWADTEAFLQPENLFSIPIDRDPVDPRDVEHLETTWERDLKGIQAIKRLGENNYIKGHAEIEPGRREKDINRAGLFFLRKIEEQYRGANHGSNYTGDLGQVLGGSARVMTEFFATGGLSTVFKGMSKRAMNKILKNFSDTFMKRALVGAVGFGAKTTARWALSPQETARVYARRRVDSVVEITPRGLSLLKHAHEAPMTSLLKAGATTWVMFGAESAGVFMNPAAKVLQNSALKALPQALQKVFRKLYPGEKVSKLFTKGGMDSFTSELGEVYLESLVLGVMDLDRRPGETPEDLLERVYSAMPNEHEFKLAMGSIGLMSGAKASLQLAFDAIQSKKKEIKYVEPTIKKEFTDADAQAWVDNFRAQTGHKPAEGGSKVEKPVSTVTSKPAAGGAKVASPTAKGKGGMKFTEDGDPFVGVDPTAETTGRATGPATKPSTKEATPTKKKTVSKEETVDVKKKDSEQAESFDDAVESISLTRRLDPMTTDAGKMTTEEYLEEANLDPNTLEQLSSSDPLKRVEAREKITELLVDGKLRAIREEMKGTEEKFYKLMGQRMDLDSSDTSLDKQIKELFTKLEDYDADIEHLKSSAAPFVTNEFNERIVTTNQKIYRMVKAIEKELRADAKAAVGAAVKGTRATIEETQKKLIEIIQRSGMSREDQQYFLKSIEKVQTPKDLLSKLEPGIYESGPRKGEPRRGLLDQIQDKLDSAERKAIVGKLKSLFKKGKSKKNKTRLANPYVQQELDMLHKASKLNTKEAGDRRAVIRKELDTLKLNQDQVDDRHAELKALNRAGGMAVKGRGKAKTELSLDTLRSLHDHVKQIVTEGKLAYGEVVFQRKLNAVISLRDTMGTLVGPEMAKKYQEWHDLEVMRKEHLMEGEADLAKLASEYIEAIKDQIENTLPSQIGKQEFHFIGGSHNTVSFPNLLDEASVHDPSRAYESKLSKIGSIAPTISKRTKADLVDEALLEKARQDAYGKKKHTGVKGVAEDHTTYAVHQNQFVVHDYGLVKVPKTGQRVSLRASTEDLKGLYAALLDVDTGPKIIAGHPFDINGVIFKGIPTELYQAVFGDTTEANFSPITEPNLGEAQTGLTEADRKMVRSMIKLLQEKHGPELREMFASEDGVLLTLKPSYWPKVSEGGAPTAFESLYGSHFKFTPGDISATQQRTETGSAILIRPATQTYTQYVKAKNHYIHFTDQLRTLETIFKDPNVRRVLKKRHGQTYLDAIDGYLEFFGRGYIADRGAAGRVVDALSSNHAVSVMGGIKISNFIKQMTSFPALATEMPPGYTTADFLKLAAETAMDPMKNYEILLETGWLQGRHKGGMSIELNNALHKPGMLQMVGEKFASEKVQRALTYLRKSPSYINLSLFAVQAGDVGAIVLGGNPLRVAWTEYYQTKAGGNMSPEEAHQAALVKFIEASSRTQQDQGMDQTPSVRRGTGLGGALLASVGKFRTSPWAYAQAYAQPFRNFGRNIEYFQTKEGGNMSETEAKVAAGKKIAEAIAIFQVLLPALFLGVTDVVSELAGDEDYVEAEDYGISMALGPYHGYFLWGKFLNFLGPYAYNKLLGTDVRESHAMEMLPFVDTFMKLVRGQYVDFSGELSGHPLKRIVQVFDALSDIMEGDVMDAFLQSLGAGTTRQIKGPKKRKSKTKGLGF